MGNPAYLTEGYVVEPPAVANMGAAIQPADARIVHVGVHEIATVQAYAPSDTHDGSLIIRASLVPPSDAFPRTVWPIVTTRAVLAGVAFSVMEDLEVTGARYVWVEYTFTGGTGSLWIFVGKKRIGG